MKNRYLITGATGFIGANFTRSLVKEGENVSVIVRDKKLNWRINDIASKIKIYKSDILSPSLDTLVSKIRPDYIIHMAAYGVMPHEDSVKKMIEVNIKGTINLVNAVKKNKFKLLINIGSAVEYGVKNHKISEKDLLEPINDYGITKAGATLFCQKEGIKNNLPIVTLRLFTPFGYLENKSRLIPSVILSAINNDPIRVSVPTSVRDFVFIEDIIDAFDLAMKRRITPGEIINIGSGKQHSVGEIVGKVMEISGSKSKVEWGAVKKQARFIEPKRLEGDISKAYKVLNWKPRYDLEQGLNKTVDWFKENQKLYE